MINRYTIKAYIEEHWIDLVLISMNFIALIVGFSIAF